MDGIKNWAYSVCTAAVAITLLSMLTPHGKMEKMMRFTISLFFISLIVFPLANGFKDFKFESRADFEYISSVADGEFVRAGTVELFKRKLEAALTNKLRQININCDYLSADINIDGNNCIIISRIYIELKKEYERKEKTVLRLFKKEVNCIPEIKYK